eukprot:6213877-Pleurochrysis_carterae.AAC.2
MPFVCACKWPSPRKPSYSPRETPLLLKSSRAEMESYLSHASSLPSKSTNSYSSPTADARSARERRSNRGYSAEPIGVGNRGMSPKTGATTDKPSALYSAGEAHSVKTAVSARPSCLMRRKQLRYERQKPWMPSSTGRPSGPDQPAARLQQKAEEM